MSEKIRCDWVDKSQIYMDYHDNEWGIPEHEDNKLFEIFILETMQAGLSWITILKKREAYREAFDNFDAYKIVHYDTKKIEELMQNTGIVRNRLKINSVISNAKLFIELTEKYGSFDQFIWSYVNHTPIIGNWETMQELPATTLISDKISKDLKKLGFKFVGSTTIYAFMQAAGLVNDHLTKCFRYGEVEDK